MRSAKTNNFSSIQELLTALRDLSRGDTSAQNLKNIVTAAFNGEEGLINSRLQYYCTKNPILWAEEVDSLVGLLSPGSQLFVGSLGLFNSCDYPIQIEEQVLPGCVLGQMSGQGQRKGMLLRCLKKQIGGKFYISTWEWFWCSFCHGLLVGSPSYMRSWPQEEEEDELFHKISHNPYLLILKNALNYSYKKDNLLDRLKTVIEVYTLQESLQKKNKIQHKNQIKQTQLLTLFLAQPQSIGYHEFFIKATEHFTALNPPHNLPLIIRSWLAHINPHSPDHLIVQQLQHSNPKDGWYRLQRCPLSQYQHHQRGALRPQDLPPVITVRRNLYRILSKTTDWQPSFSLLSSLEQFLFFDLQVLMPQLRNTLQPEEEDTLNKAFERILIKLAESGAPIAALQKRQEEVNSNFGETLRPLSINFREKCEKARQSLSKTNRELSESISYQDARIRNVWEHPIQQNEYYILYQGALWVSTQLDKLIPGYQNRPYPLANLRILANPFVFFGLLLLLALWAKCALE